MSNMRYCRFQNTALDLKDCIDAIYEREIEDLSRSEIRAAKNLLRYAEELLELEDELLIGIENSESNAKKY